MAVETDALETAASMDEAAAIKQTSDELSAAIEDERRLQRVNAARSAEKPTSTKNSETKKANSMAADDETYLDRVLTMEVGRCTEAAAVAASTMIGHGDKEGADDAAVTALRNAFNKLEMDGTVVIGRRRTRRSTDALYRREGWHGQRPED